MYSRLGPCAALFQGQDDHDGDVWYRAPSCSDASQSDLRACTPASTPPLSSLYHVSRARPPFLYTTAVALLYDPNGHNAPSNAALLPRLFSCPFPKDPAPFLQTKIIVVLAIHLPTDSYTRHNLHATELLEGSSTRPMRSSRTELSRTRAPIAAKQQRRSSGNCAAWPRAAMQFTCVALVIYGSAALAPASLASLLRGPLRVCRQHPRYFFRENILWAG
ncbi:hypothetical protein K438DRAFT_2025606, partial [Mycena galopus ATCC 62051]